MITSEQVRQCQNNSLFIFANETPYQLSYTPAGVDNIITLMTFFSKKSGLESDFWGHLEKDCLWLLFLIDGRDAVEQLNPGGLTMKNSSDQMSKTMILILALVGIAAPAANAGANGSFSRNELMGNSQLMVWREADFGNQLGLSIYIDGIPVTSLSWGEAYQAVVRPGRHVLTVTDTPCPYGKTKFTHRTIDFKPGQTYAFTAVWEVETILLENGHRYDRGFYWQ